MTTLPLDTPQLLALRPGSGQCPRRIALLFNSALFMLALWLGCSALELVDHRLINGVSVWVKPAKFFLSLAVHLATVAWALSLLTPQARATRGMHGAPG
ncbi:MAG: hypothetical protein U1E15_09260 [Hyphomicrobiales bacterium]